MSKLVRTFKRNTKGRDFAVGDIHGWFTRLAHKLDEVGFDPEVDRLFPAGDLVDRGPESHLILQYLRYLWFNAIKGNHEELLIGYANIPPHRWGRHGTEWFYDLTQAQRREYAEAFKELPAVIEVETSKGKVGIVHAECVNLDWNDMIDNLNNTKGKKLKQQLHCCLWSQDRYALTNTEPVKNIRAVIVGHIPVDEVTVLGNTYYIDTTGGKEDRNLTLINLETLETF